MKRTMQKQTVKFKLHLHTQSKTDVLNANISHLSISSFCLSPVCIFLWAKMITNCHSPLPSQKYRKSEKIVAPRGTVIHLIFRLQTSIYICSEFKFWNTVCVSSLATAIVNCKRPVRLIFFLFWGFTCRSYTWATRRHSGRPWINLDHLGIFNVCLNLDTRAFSFFTFIRETTAMVRIETGFLGSAAQCFSH